jgi:hypothetical protein
MPDTALVVPSNLSHNVPALLDSAKTRFSNLAKLYLVTKVAGQFQATLDAKRRDLDRFLAFYRQLYGHDRPEEWFVSVTKAFLKRLWGQRLAQLPWSASTPPCGIAPAGSIGNSPTSSPWGVPPTGSNRRRNPRPTGKGLTRTEELRLFSAAQMLRVRHGLGTKQGLRNHTLMAVLLGSSLRTFEVLQLDRDQYTSKGFARVQMKGGPVPRFYPRRTRRALRCSELRISGRRLDNSMHCQLRFRILRTFGDGGAQWSWEGFPGAASQAPIGAAHACSSRLPERPPALEG